MNTLTFRGHTSCICLHEKQSDQIVPLHANPTALRHSLLILAQPSNFHLKQMFFFFFALHNTSNPTQTLLLAAWFQASSNLKFNSTPKALPTLLMFNCTWWKGVHWLRFSLCVFAFFRKSSGTSGQKWMQVFKSLTNEWMWTHPTHNLVSF